MKIRAFLTSLLLATGLIFTTSHAVAQAQGGGGGRGRGGMGMGVLTQEQRNTIRDTVQGEMGPLRQKLAAAQKEVVKAALENASEETVKSKIEAVNKVQTEIAVLRLKAVKAIAPTLTSEQKTQLESAPDGGYMALFGGGFGGGFGRGAGGGRRGGSNN